MPKPPSAASSPRPSPRQPLRSIPPIVLLSFAVIHSQVYWLYSVIYHLYQTLPDRTVDLDETVRNALTRRSGRARAFSDPQQSSSVVLQRRQTISSHQMNTCSSRGRPRSTTISATTVDADANLRRQQWVQHVHACLEEQESLDDSNDGQTTLVDERLGRTRPPRWWQRTKRHLTRQDKDDETDSGNNHLASTLSLPANIGSSASTPIDSSTTTPSLLALAVANNSLSQNIQSVSPASCDLQHHHDITNPSLTDRTNSILVASHSSETNASSSSVSSTVSTNTPKRSLDSQRAAISSSQQRRPLAKIRSVFMKSQIEPENALEPKRKTILGIPSRWSTSTNNDSSPPPHEQQPPTKTKKRQSVRIKVPTTNSPTTSSPLAKDASTPPPKKRLFSSLPIWKRKSVDR